jgi:hypothetical protein
MARRDEGDGVPGEIVFLCASTLESTRILLNFTRFPNGLANSSGVLGHYLMDHYLHAPALWSVPWFKGKRTGGRMAFTSHVSKTSRASKRDFFAATGTREEATERLPRGFQLQFGNALPAGFGVEFKEAMKELPVYVPSGFESVFLTTRTGLRSAKMVDKWGIPALHITATWFENELAMYDQIRGRCRNA